MSLQSKTLVELLDYGLGVDHPTTLEAELLRRLEKFIKLVQEPDLPALLQKQAE